MDRRTFLIALSAAFPLVARRRVPLAAQDLEFIRALDRAQTERPATILATARIAPEAEPGTPLVIHGRVHADEKTPLAGATVFAYHTDRGGLYDQPSAGSHSWRLKGWARTGADGRFEFRTMRPGGYPGRTIPAHVHFTVFTADARYHAGELRFDDDPLVRDDERAQSKARGAFAWIRPVRLERGTQHVDHAIKIEASQKF